MVTKTTEILREKFGNFEIDSLAISVVGGGGFCLCFVFVLFH